MAESTLIVLAGLPGSGKSTLAEGLSRALSFAIFSVDPIEASMWRGGLSQDQTGIAAYEVAAALADEHLRLGHSVIIDAVNPTEAPRAVWRKLAVKHRASLKIIECTCANEITHRQRVAARVRNIEGMPELCWEDVLVRRAAYEAWTDMRLVLDTSANDPSVSMARAIEYLRN